MADLEERTRLSQALNDIDIRIHANLGSDEIMQGALDGFVGALGADVGDIKLIDGDEWVVRYERGLGSGEIGLRLSIDEAPVAVQVASIRSPVVIDDYLAQNDVPYVGFPARHDLRSTIAVPLVVRGEVVGCLFAWMREPREYSPAEVDFARRMAASVALALENARLFEAEHVARQRAESAERRLGQELDRTRILLRASDELTSTIDTNELLERVARIALEATGIGRAFVNLIDMNRGVLIPKVATGGLVAPGGAVIPLSELSWTSSQAIQRKRTSLLDYDLASVPERDREIAASNRARLVLFVPLVYRGEVTGHISLDEPGERYEFSPEQIRTVEGIAALVSVALQDAVLFEREHRIAETLQLALMAPPEDIDAVEIATLYRAASVVERVGGDFYDVFELDSEHVALVVGDVAGKGIRAAQLTALMRDGVRAYLLESVDPESCIARLNALAHRFTPVGKYATVFLGVLHRSSGRLRYCNAGHPGPVVIAPGELRVLECHSPILGAFADVPFEAAEETLGTGEVLVVVTDGVTEMRRGSAMFGDDGLVDALERLRGIPIGELPDALLSEVIDFGGGGLHDDVVILCASRDVSG